MTENKPIITHGVDVSKCINYACNICTATRDNYGDSFHFCDDIEMKDCYFKRLARKTQAEERLVQQIQTICDFINNRPEIFKGIYGGVDKIITDYAERKEQECEKLKEENFNFEQLIKEYEKYGTIEEIIQQLDQLKAEKQQAERKLERIREFIIEVQVIPSASGILNKILQIIDEVK